MTFISKKLFQYKYFAEQLGDDDWTGKDILDFGGNIGNMLLDPRSTIDKTRYWCIDVDRGAIETGRKLHPESHWHHYDRHCYFFNPGGVVGLRLPALDQTFDYIVAYSVFTNTLRRDMLDLVGQLRALLKPGGTLAFTFIDPHHRSWPDRFPGDNLLWRLVRDNTQRPETDIAALARRARDADWCILVNGNLLYVETDDVVFPTGPQRSCHAHFTPRHMLSTYPDATIRPPANREMQHCCLLS